MKQIHPTIANALAAFAPPAATKQQCAECDKPLPDRIGGATDWTTAGVCSKTCWQYLTCEVPR